MALGWKHFALIGHSMGASVSMLYAGTFPEYVTKLVLVDGAVPLQASEDKARETLRLSILSHSSVRSSKVGRIETSMDAAEARLLDSNPALTLAAARRLLERGATACEGGYRFTRDIRVRFPSAFRLSEEMVNSFIRHVSCDVLMIMAEGSTLHEVVGDRERRQFELLAKCARSFELVRVPGSHHVHMNDPAAVGPHVRRFLEAEPLTAKL